MARCRALPGRAQSLPVVVLLLVAETISGLFQNWSRTCTTTTTTSTSTVLKIPKRFWISEFLCSFTRSMWTDIRVGIPTGTWVGFLACPVANLGRNSCDSVRGSNSVLGYPGTLCTRVGVPARDYPGSDEEDGGAGRRSQACGGGSGGQGSDTVGA